MTTFIRVEGSSTFDGTVEDCSDNPISGASVVLSDCYFYLLGADTTDSSGDYSIEATLNGNSPYYLTVIKTRFNSGFKGVSGEGTNDFELVGIGEKIAVIFWASDATNSSVIANYKYILGMEGYNTEDFVFEDCENVIGECNAIDDYEIDADTIFVYIIGHGTNGGGHSYTTFRPLGSNFSSNYFCEYQMDIWEANRKCILVESCYSGDWADDFAKSPYLAMSTADENNIAHCFGDPEPDPPAEGDFSHYFFVRIAAGDTAVEAFNFACGAIANEQNPKKSDNSDYDWFDD